MSADPLTLSGSSPDDSATVEDCKDDYDAAADVRAAFDAECQ